MNLLNEANTNIKNKIRDSKKYSDYVYYLTSNTDTLKKLVSITSYEKDGKKDNFLSKVVDNVDFFHIFSNEFGFEDHFSVMINKSFENEPIFERIIDTKFAENLYGNTVKEDLTNIDALFKVFESVFSLDTIIESVANGTNILDNRLHKVMNDNNPNLSIEFVNLINKIYKETEKASNYEEVKGIMKNYNSELYNYVTPGIMLQIDEYSKDLNKRTLDSSYLIKNMEEIIGPSKNKIM